MIICLGMCGVMFQVKLSRTNEMAIRERSVVTVRRPKWQSSALNLATRIILGKSQNTLFLSLCSWY